MKFKIEVTNDASQVFSCSTPGAMPENKEHEPFVLEGELEDIQKKACLMVALITAVAANDDKVPEMFASTQEFVNLPNPFFGIK